VDTSGEKTVISGTVKPELSIDLKILCDNNIIATIKSSNDGKFNYIWCPKDVGKHFIKVIHDGSELTKSAESNIITVTVEAQPTPTKTSTPLYASLESTPQKTSAEKPSETKTPGFDVISVIVIIIVLALRRII